MVFSERSCHKGFYPGIALTIVTTGLCNQLELTGALLVADCISVWNYFLSIENPSTAIPCSLTYLPYPRLLYECDRYYGFKQFLLYVLL